MKVIITHTDLDGVASAALILRGVGSVDKIFFAQPNQLYGVLRKIPNGADVYVSDLGMNTSILERVLEEVERIIKGGGRIRWFDHHIWKEEWIAGLKDRGVEIYVDTSTCGAGVVARYLPVEGEGVGELVSATCSIDLWRFNDWRGNFLARYVGFKGGAEWREKVAYRLKDFDGMLSQDIIDTVSQVFDEELKTYSRILREAKVTRTAGMTIAYVLKKDDEHTTSYIGNLLLNRFQAKIAVICREGSVSFRSIGDTDVSSLAMRLGGGGHKNAAGAPIKAPLLHRFLRKVGIKGPYLSWCISRVVQTLESE